MNTYISTHKKTSIFLGIVIILILYLVIHALTKSKAPTAYVLGTATNGTVISTVTGTGQVSNTSTLDINPQVSGTLTSVRVNAGDSVSKGQVLFTIQATDAAQAVQTAQDNLAAAKLDLESTETSINDTTTNDSTAVTNAYNTLLSSGLTAQPADQNTSDYQQPTISGNYLLGKEGTITITTYNSQGGISFQSSGLVSSTGLTNSVTPQPIGNSGLYILFPDKIIGGLTWNIAIPNTGSPNYISNETAYNNAVQTQTEDNDPSGTNAVTLQSKQLAVTEAEDSLESAEQTLAEYTITAPFSGIMATSPEFVGDNVSPSSTLGTLITNEQVVDLSLNEVDVAKITVGDKATLTFDAVSGLTLTGTVQTIDPVGTVSSGVVNYSVTLSLDTQDPRVKSGMSVTADIQAGIAADTLTVPSSAVKTTNGSSYVLTVPKGDTSTPVAASGTTTTGQTGEVTLLTPPVATSVTTGLTDGITTQITSGLTEGQSIVTKTVVASATTTPTAAATATTSTRGGGFGGGGGAIRAL
jgi:HlyD family secretion protein